MSCPVPWLELSCSSSWLEASCPAPWLKLSYPDLKLSCPLSATWLELSYLYLELYCPAICHMAWNFRSYDVRFLATYPAVFPLYSSLSGAYTLFSTWIFFRQVSLNCREVVAVGVKDPYTCAKLGMTLIYFEAYYFSFWSLSVRLSQTLNLAERRICRWV